jgi:hypothetical protein
VDCADAVAAFYVPRPENTAMPAAVTEGSPPPGPGRSQARLCSAERARKNSVHPAITR